MKENWKIIYRAARIAAYITQASAWSAVQKATISSAPPYIDFEKCRAMLKLGRHVDEIAGEIANDAAAAHF